MRDDDYIRMCSQDFAANSRQSNDNNSFSKVTICIIIVILIGLFYFCGRG